MATNPATSDYVDVWGVRLNSNQDIGAFIGGTWTNKGDSALTSVSSTVDYEAFSLAYQLV